MSESKGAMRAVDAMVDAIRADEPPAVRWEAVERSLLQRVRRGEGARPAARPASGLWQVLAFAAAAAIVPIGLSLGASSSGAVAVEPIHTIDVSQVASAPAGDAALGAHDLGALQRGDAVEANASEVTFADSGKVRWTLSPESRLVVRAPLPSSGVGHVVRLERGSLRVEVQPDLVRQGLVDVLAVEVGNTRVAVHGTAFTVSLRNGEVLVDVEHGVVTVGPTGQAGGTTGYQLAAGIRAAFSLDGGRQARWMRPGEPMVLPPSAVAAAGVVNAAPTLIAPSTAVAQLALPAVAPSSTDDVPAMVDPPPAAAKLAGSVKSAAPVAPPAGAGGASTSSTVAAEPATKAGMSVGQVQAKLKHCFTQAHPPTEGATRLTATSTLTLMLNADGTVSAAQFNPPLPSIQGCAAFVYGGKFAPTGTNTLQIPVSLSN